MRHRLNTPSNDVVPDFKFYKHQTRSDSNGPIQKATKVGLTDNGDEVVHSYKIAKPYFSVCCNSGFEETLNGTHASAFDYALFKTVLDSHIDLEALYDPQPAENNAILKSLETGRLMLAVSAAEFVKTQNMVKTAFVRAYNLLFDIYKSAKRGKFVSDFVESGKDLNVRDLYEFCSNAWLEYRYGWTPLIGELNSIRELVTSTYATSSLLSKYGTQSYEDLDYVLTLPPNFQISVENDHGVQVTQTFNGEIRIKSVFYRCSFNYINTIESRNRSLLAQLGLDSESILSTAWELIPFSFLLDFVLKAGDLLQSESFANDVSPFNGCLTTTIDYEIFGSLGEPQDDVMYATQWFEAFSFETFHSIALPMIRDYWTELTTTTSFNNPTLLQNVQGVGFVVDAAENNLRGNNIGDSNISALNEKYGTTVPSGSVATVPYYSFNYDLLKYNRVITRTPIVWPLSNGDTVEDDSVTLRVEYPYPQYLIDHFFEEIDPMDGGAELELSLSLAFYDYELGYTDEQGRPTNRTRYNFNEFLQVFYPNEPKNLMTREHKMDHPEIPGELIYRIYRFPHQGNFEDSQSAYDRLGSRARFYKPRPNVSDVNPVFSGNLNQHFSTGRVTKRVIDRDIEYIPRLNYDLSSSQYADLAIFAERLVTAITSKKK